MITKESQAVVFILLAFVSGMVTATSSGCDGRNEVAVQSQSVGPTSDLQ
ncbi:hypothetical protein [Aureliella helgolandensis]|nr:hypothetical protein [Aureliella helgolandensis]